MAVPFAIAIPGVAYLLFQNGFAALNALPGSFGARRSYNSTGSFAVQATFADKSQGLLRLDIP